MSLESKTYKNLLQIPAWKEAQVIYPVTTGSSVSLGLHPVMMYKYAVYNIDILTQ